MEISVFYVRDLHGTVPRRPKVKIAVDFMEPVVEMVDSKRDEGL